MDDDDQLMKEYGVQLSVRDLQLVMNFREYVCPMMMILVLME